MIFVQLLHFCPGTHSHITLVWLLCRASPQHAWVSQAKYGYHAGFIYDWQRRQWYCFSLCWRLTPCCHIRIACDPSLWPRSTLVVRAMSGFCLYLWFAALECAHTAQSRVDSTQTDSAAAIVVASIPESGCPPLSFWVVSRPAWSWFFFDVAKKLLKLSDFTSLTYVRRS